MAYYEQVYRLQRIRTNVINLYPENYKAASHAKQIRSEELFNTDFKDPCLSALCALGIGSLEYRYLYLINSGP